MVLRSRAIPLHLSPRIQHFFVHYLQEPVDQNEPIPQGRYRGRRERFKPLPLKDAFEAWLFVVERNVGIVRDTAHAQLL